MPGQHFYFHLSSSAEHLKYSNIMKLKFSATAKMSVECAKKHTSIVNN